MENAGLNGSGLIFMIVSWIAIISLNVYCFYNIFKEKEEKIVGPLEVEAEMDKEANS